MLELTSTLTDQRMSLTLRSSLMAMYLWMKRVMKASCLIWFTLPELCNIYTSNSCQLTVWILYLVLDQSWFFRSYANELLLFLLFHYSSNQIAFARSSPVSSLPVSLLCILSPPFLGTQYKTIVEYAPSQHVPKQRSKKDGREGTIQKGIN